MENASKAIVIAGSILVAVMLVSLGVLIYNLAADVTQKFTGTFDDLARVAANQPYLQYIGNDKKATETQSLLDLVSANNSNKNSARTIEVTTFKGGSFDPTSEKVDSASDIMTLRSQVVERDTLYDIAVTEVDSDGVIAGVSITGKSR